MTAAFMNMYCVYDNKAEAYDMPFWAPNDAVATRVVMDAMRDPRSSLAAHPADYNLFHVGIWKSQTGEVGGVNPRNMGLLVDFLPKPETPAPLFERS